ncbi:MAG: ABC transporter permease [Candidatus Cloacimonetes bacterium]|nr:ABC transporter permease [Candidatus Cloacimonadota bacterium]
MNLKHINLEPDTKHYLWVIIFSLLGFILFSIAIVCFGILFQIEQPVYLGIMAGSALIISTGVGFFIKKRNTHANDIKKKTQDEIENVIECPDLCKKGVNLYLNRYATDLRDQLSNIKKNSEIIIFLIDLKQVVKWFEQTDIQQSIANMLPKITIYALDPNNEDEVFNELCLYYSKNSSQELKSEININYNKFLKDIEPLYKKNNIEINFNIINVFKNGSPIAPIPPFQWFGVNDFVYINPLITMYIHDGNIIAPTENLDDFMQSEKKRLKDSVHIRFHRNNKDANQMLSDYENTLNFYIQNCLNENRNEK